jgi:cobalt/nickel transport system permease protein
MKSSGFLDKTLLAAARTGRQALLSELFAAEPGLLQSLDVRVKLVTFLGILVCISFLHTPISLGFLCLTAVVLALTSRVPALFFLKRVWLVVPLFSAAIVLPATLNIVTPGRVLLVLVRFSHARSWGGYTIPAELAITREGVLASGTFLLRVGASVSFAVLLTLTSRWTRVFAGLRALFVPRIFVVTLAMTERYLFVLLTLIEDMYRARKSRTITPRSASHERNWTASRIGVAFRKAMHMSEDIHHAMVSRGFHGEFPAIERPRLSAADAVWTLSALAAGVLLLLFERGRLHP